MSRRAGASTAPLLAGGMIGLAAGAIGYLLGRRAVRTPRWPPDASRALRSDPPEPSPRPEASRAAARRLYAGSAVLASSVLADSGLEHYRGGFYNPVMYVAPTTAALTLATSSASAAGADVPARTPVFAAAVLAGLVGSGFHTYNVARRVGGWRWMNLFYGAPLAAPMGLVFAGLFGLAARHLREDPGGSAEVSERTLGGALALASAAGLLGTAAEAGLLHFRGAFQDPYMLLPVTVPPVTALALAGTTLAPRSVPAGTAQMLLRLTQALGFAGVGFHAFGVQRNMGGWSNWSQMILQGPPLPAPPSFTGMALAGEAALALLEADGGDA